MKKHNEFVISISLDTVTVACLDALVYYFDHSRSWVMRKLVERHYESTIDPEADYKDELSAEFDFFPKTHRFSILMDELSLDLLDDLVDESELSHSAVLRGLVLREFRELVFNLKETIY